MVFAQAMSFLANNLNWESSITTKTSLFNEILMIALTAACVFSIFDLVSPSISAGARQGVGLGAGFRLIGFPGM